MSFIRYAIATLLAVASPSLAIVIYNTGVDAAGVPLSDGAQDPHYIIAATGQPTPVQTISATPAADALSAWVIPDTDRGPGGYTYQTTFVWPVAEPITITGQWAADVEGQYIYFNGIYDTADAIPQPSDLAWHPFQITADAIAGTNTLSFTAYHGFDGPTTGLRTEIFSVLPVPEPASFVLVAASLPLLRRRR